MKPSETAPHELNLVSSSRLRALREKQQHEKTGNIHATQTTVLQSETSDLTVAQAMINQAIQQVLDKLPVGKQHSLFKIRYGTDPAGIKQLPILEIFKRLGISQNALTNPQTLAQLNYNGERISSD